MSFISMQGRGPDGRLDKVIEKLAKVHGDAQEHISSLSEVDVMQQESIEQLQRDIMQLEASADFTNNRTTDVTRRTALIEDDVKSLKSRPTPVIPDIRPLRSELLRVQVTQDELLLAFSRENKALWDVCKELKFEAMKIRGKPSPVIWPLYILAISALLLGIFANVGQL